MQALLYVLLFGCAVRNVCFCFNVLYVRGLVFVLFVELSFLRDWFVLLCVLQMYSWVDCVCLLFVCVIVVFGACCVVSGCPVLVLCVCYCAVLFACSV